MNQVAHLSINIPRQLIDELANAIVVRVMRQLESHLDQAIVTQTARRNLEEPMPRPTFLRPREVSERVGLARSTICI